MFAEKQLSLDPESDGSNSAPVSTNEEVVPKNVKQSLALFVNLSNRIGAVSKVKLTDEDANEQLERALAKLPNPGAIASEIEDARNTLLAAIDTERADQAALFGRNLTAYLRDVQSRGVRTRELTDAWRIEHLVLELNPEQARAQVRYNGEVVVPWTVIRKSEDFSNLTKKAEQLLARSEIDLELFHSALNQAYDYLLTKQRDMGKSSTQAVPVIDLYREVRAAIVRVMLEGQKPDKQIAVPPLQKWSFLYNMDRYRSQAGAKVTGRRLTLQTGSQQEVQRGLGLAFGGLGSVDEYKIYCHVLRPLAED